MIFPGFPGVVSFFQVFQVEWEPCNMFVCAKLFQLLSFICEGGGHLLPDKFPPIYSHIFKYLIGCVAWYFYLLLFFIENFIHFNKWYTVHLIITKNIINNICLKFPTFPVFHLIFPDFSSLFKIPWQENAFPFLQVFQLEWEPWLVEFGIVVSLTHFYWFDTTWKNPPESSSATGSTPLKPALGTPPTSAKY